MTDYAPNYSARLKLFYTTLGKPHSVTFRYGFLTDAPSAGFKSAVADIILAAGPLLFSDFAVTAAAWCGAGVTTFLPTPIPVFGGGIGAVSPPATSLGYTPLNVGYMGLSDGAAKSGFRLFGFAVDPAATEGVYQDYRLYGAEQASVAATLASLADAEAEGLTAIDCLPVQWHQYANVGFHSHWQRKARG